MKLITLISYFLVLIGGLNWTLVGFMGLDLFVMFGGGTVLTTVLYLLTTIATLYVVFPHAMKHLQTA